MGAVGCWEGSRERPSVAAALPWYPASSILTATSIPRRPVTGSLTIDLIGNHHLGRGLAGTPRGLGTPGTLLGRAVPETRP